MNYSGAIHVTIPTLPAPNAATTGVISYPEVYPLSLFEPKGNEQALVVNVNGQGLVLIIGCGHPTIERLVERAEALYGLPVAGVVGGLHYEGFIAADVQPHIQFLKSRQIKLAALSPHDSSIEALEAFQSAFAESYHLLRVGESIQFPQLLNR
jgi:7,8-dihydropterin-6-yl-methyl-4-(beta-D-ribofuranosyl)aminobenzene 5'-phosphate synthase